MSGTNPYNVELAVQGGCIRGEKNSGDNSEWLISYKLSKLDMRCEISSLHYK